MRQFLSFSLLFLCIISIHAQRFPEADEVVVSQHKLVANGQAFDYTAKTGTQPVWDEKGKTIATLHYTYYTRNNVKNSEERPLLISFNGGPGSASVWMHLAYTGPKLINIDDEGYPLQPYGVKDNPYSVLDVADIVYVNPVNTGYSRVLDDRSEEHTSELQSRPHLVCRLLLEK